MYLISCRSIQLLSMTPTHFPLHLSVSSPVLLVQRGARIGRYQAERVEEEEGDYCGYTMICRASGVQANAGVYRQCGEKRMSVLVYYSLPTACIAPVAKSSMQTLENIEWCSASKAFRE